MSPVPALLTGAAAALTLALGTRPVLRALVEPTDEDGESPADKIAYAMLPTRRFVLTVAVLGGLLVGLSTTVLPVPVVPLWFALGTGGLLLAAIDARTTWLPLTLTRAAWVLTLLAAALGAILGFGRGDPAGGLLLWALVGAFVGWAFFGLVWWLSRGALAFGDVRFAPLVGAASGAYGPSLIGSALLLGALAGGAYGVVRLLRRQRGPFPYAPAIFAGAWLALLVEQLR